MESRRKWSSIDQLRDVNTKREGIHSSVSIAQGLANLDRGCTRANRRPRELGDWGSLAILKMESSGANL